MVERGDYMPLGYVNRVRWCAAQKPLLGHRTKHPIQPITGLAKEAELNRLTANAFRRGAG